MTERPIIFSAPMVRAILDGSKIQTRREVKKMPPTLPGWWKAMHFASAGHFIRGAAAHCPYGQPGDLLWVRETWGAADEWVHSCETDPPRTVAYKADLSARDFDPERAVDTTDWGWESMKWRPSIHMPRWASRITLEITGVRVERLQDISDADAFDEGIQQCVNEGVESDGTARGTYRALWESLYGPGSWAANPWVWVIEFRRIKP